jgi:hypothetical protein
MSGRKFTRNLAVLGLIAGVFAISGCGGDEEEASTTPSNTTQAETATTESVPTETDEAPPPAETTPEPATTPEDMPGGAGDEEPARTLALFTADGGRIRPRVVRVPAFISIQVELRSADGQGYGLRFGDTTIEAGGDLNSASTTIDGLRPGKAIMGRPTLGGNSVRIEATAEPGP